MIYGLLLKGHKKNDIQQSKVGSVFAESNLPLLLSHLNSYLGAPEQTYKGARRSSGTDNYSRGIYDLLHMYGLHLANAES